MQKHTIGKTVSRKRALGLKAACMRETPDPTPLEIPEGHQRPLSLREDMQRFIRAEISRVAQETQHGSFDEEDDFDEDDAEPDILTPYEAVCMLDEANQENLDGAEAPQEEAPLKAPQEEPPTDTPDDSGGDQT